MRLEPVISEKERVERADAADAADRDEPVPIWQNTRPRGNPEPDLDDVGRSRAKLESVLGR
jgi:hypothetical protein